MAQQHLISNINRDIIQWCCDEISITLAELATAVKIPLSKLEQVTLSFTQLKKIADYFGYGLLFFLGSEQPQADKVHTAAFRSLANQKIRFDRNIKKIVEQVESHRDLYLSLLDDMGEQHCMQLPQLSGSISDKAQTTREWLEIKSDQGYDFDLYRQLIEAKGILIFRSMGYNGKWKVQNDALIGFSIYHATAPAIFITQTSPPRQTFTLFHELGHLLLHQGSFIDDETNLQSDQHAKQEQAANQFAAQCLLPDELVKSDLVNNIEPENYSETLKPLARQLGISVEVIVVSLLNKKFITHTNYSDYKAIQGQQHPTIEAQEQSVSKQPIPRNYRHREPKHIFGDIYVKTILDSLNSNQITLNKASDYLDRLTISDLKKLSAFCVQPN